MLDTLSYRDLGDSAFKGRNARASSAPSCVLPTPVLVESLDRLSRNDVDEALELFLSIIRRGVILLTLGDGQTYSTASIKRDPGMSLIVRILVTMQAHMESVTKGGRASESGPHGKGARRAASQLRAQLPGVDRTCHRPVRAPR